MKTNNTGGRMRRAVAILGALALSLTGALALAAPASAADPVPGNMPTTNGSITIHKFVQPASPTTLPHDGSAIDPSLLTGLTALNGVEYKVQGVGNINLTTNAGWDIVKTLAPGDVGGATYPFISTATGTTSSGIVAFTGLPIGVYLVTETDAGANQIPSLAAPFLVTVPLPVSNGTNGANGTWLSNIHVYPKNPLTAIDKTVNDSTAHALGDTVNWSITAKVPNLATGQDLTSFTVTDKLDTRLTYVPTAAVSFKNAGGTNVPLVAADYTVDYTAPTVSVAFTTPTGLAKLKANQGGTVTVDIATTVNSIGTGTIPNTAIVNINGKDFETLPAKTTWGALVINKKAAGSNAALAGAEFAVYASAADALAGAPVVASGTSAADGSIHFNGLKAQNNGDGANLEYFIVETKAPTGYTVNPAFTPANPTKVTIAPGDLAHAVIVDVTDNQVPPFMLPLTGSTGTVLFIGGGIALIALAMGAAFVMYRRKALAAQQQQ
ncbi:MAG: SpaH/EbpB family LPXTG-anchored major pilin [Microbacteriaceae bacterium]